MPTAENVDDDGADVYVWYYIQGADTPDGQQATEENTFNDTEPACLTVTVLTNKFDITFNAANANTIEAGKATVTVGGTAATVTEGKLEGVKMGSEVKLKAKQGYKFRKVEVKKGGPTKTIKIEGIELIYSEGDKWEKIVEKNPDLYIDGNDIWSHTENAVLSVGSDSVLPSDIVDPSKEYWWDH